MEASWESSDETVAVIENRPIAGSGEALALKVGEVTITGTGTDSATGIQATTTLKVTAAVLQRIEITPASPTLDILSLESFQARGVYTDSTTVDLTRRVVWRSTNPLVFFVSNVLSGFGIALLPGQTTITATFPLSNLEGSTTVNVRF